MSNNAYPLSDTASLLSFAEAQDFHAAFSVPIGNYEDSYESHMDAYQEQVASIVHGRLHTVLKDGNRLRPGDIAIVWSGGDGASIGWPCRCTSKLNGEWNFEPLNRKELKRDQSVICGMRAPDLFPETLSIGENQINRRFSEAYRLKS